MKTEKEINAMVDEAEKRDHEYARGVREALLWVIDEYDPPYDIDKPTPSTEGVI